MQLLFNSLQRKKCRDITFHFSFFLCVFLGLHLQHMEIPRLEVKSELQLPAYATATAMQDLSQVCDLHHSSQQCQILNPLTEARDQTRILTDTSWFCYHWEMMQGQHFFFLNNTDMFCKTLFIYFDVCHLEQSVE